MSNLLSQSNPPVANSVNATLTIQYLKFGLYPDTKAMLPIEQITEILKIKLARIMPIPQMPAWIMGVYNWRGEILWTVDIAQMLGLSSGEWLQHQRSKQTIIVLSPDRQETNKIHLGLVVAGVEDLENCSPAAIQSNLDPKGNSQLNSFARGYWLEPSGAMVLALEGKAIAAAMPAHH